MIHALLEGFDVPVKHRAGAASTHFVPDAMDIQPFLGAFLSATKFVTHLRIEYLGAATSQRAETGVLQDRESFWDGDLEDPLGEMADFDRGEGLDDDLRIERAQSLQQLEIPFLVQRRVKTADHVHLGDTGGERFFDGGDNIIDRALESMGVPLLRCKGAKLAGKDADVRVINVAIQDVSRDVAVFPLTHRTCHYAQGVQIVRAIELERIGIGKALLALDLFGNGSKITGNER